MVCCFNRFDNYIFNKETSKNLSLADKNILMLAFVISLSAFVLNELINMLVLQYSVNKLYKHIDSHVREEVNIVVVRKNYASDIKSIQNIVKIIWLITFPISLVTAIICIITGLKVVL